MFKKRIFFYFLFLTLGSLNLWCPLLLLLIDDEPDIKYQASEIVVKMKFPLYEGKYRNAEFKILWLQDLTHTKSLFTSFCKACTELPNSFFS